MDLTGNAQSDLSQEGAVVLQGGVAQVAALISGSHLRDVEGAVREEAQPSAAGRRALLRTATAEEFQPVFGPRRRPRSQKAGGGTRK